MSQLSLLCQQQPGEFRSGPTGVSRSLLGLCLFNKMKAPQLVCFPKSETLHSKGDPVTMATC